MKKSKFAAIILVLILVVVSVFALTACDEHEHTLPDNWTVTKEATCTENGTKEKACTDENCTFKVTAEIEKLGHDLHPVGMGDRVLCEVAGTVNVECSRCDYTDTANIPAPGHHFAEAKACAEEIACDYCGFVKELEPTVEHVFKTTEGHENECSVCDYAYTANMTYKYLQYSDSYSVSYGYDCKATKIVVPSKWDDGINGLKPVTAIDDVGFYNRAVVSVKLPKSVKKIGYWNFTGAPELEEFRIPETVEEIGKGCFEGSLFYNNMSETSEDGNIILDGWLLGINDDVENFVLPEGIRGIMDQVFYNKKNLKSAVLSGDFNLGNEFFSGDSLLQSVTLPNCVSIGMNAFRDCSALISITLPDTLKTIGDFAFMGCSILNQITFGGSLESLGRDVFKDAAIVDSLLSSDLYIFANWVIGYDDQATSITIPNTIIGIAGEAFLGCTALTEIELSEKVVGLGMGAFQNCTALTSVDLSKTKITALSTNLFNGCTLLTSVTLPQGITSFGDSAFRATGLTAFTIPETVTYLGTYCFYQTKLTSIDVPGSIATIGDYCFGYCGDLQSVTLHEGLITIGSSAFAPAYGTVSEPVFDLTIPASVKSIAYGAFQYIVRNIYLLATEPMDLSSNQYVDWFNYGSSAKIYVPKGSLEAYQTAWANASNLVGKLAEAEE